MTEYAGPRAQPLVDGGLVYTLSHDGQLYCLDAINGEALWAADLKSRFGFTARDQEFGFSAPPAIDGDTLVVNACEYGVALDKRTGALLWESPRAMSGYAPPVFFKQKARLASRSLARQNSISSIRPMEKSRPHATGRRNTSAISPTRSYPAISFSFPRATTRAAGCSGSRIRQAHPGLETTGPRSPMAPGVLLDGCYYANDFWYYYQKGGFRCIELATGKLKWEASLGVGSVIAVGRTLILLLETGRLIFAQATPDALKQIATANLGEKPLGQLVHAADLRALAAFCAQLRRRYSLYRSVKAPVKRKTDPYRLLSACRFSSCAPIVARTVIPSGWTRTCLFRRGKRLKPQSARLPRHCAWRRMKRRRISSSAWKTKKPPEPSRSGTMRSRCRFPPPQTVSPQPRPRPSLESGRLAGTAVLVAEESSAAVKKLLSARRRNFSHAQDTLVATCWSAKNFAALVGFAALDPQLKPLAIDGTQIFDGKANLDAYPFVLYINALGDETVVTELRRENFRQPFQPRSGQARVGHNGPCDRAHAHDRGENG